ncbi:MAG: hypothetical protein WC813_00475 [Patescibacteria group bacterium]|jgi:hypothetical protein
MQNSQLDRLLKLAKRTGDRLIVTSNDGAEPVVILPLAEYEGMLDAMTFFRSEKGGSSNPAFEENTNNEGGFDADVERGHVRNAVTAEEAEGDFDPVALERQVMAAMNREEPEVVPVETSAESQATPVPEETTRKPITRKVNQPEDGGEERFYLEAV